MKKAKKKMKQIEGAPAKLDVVKFKKKERFKDQLSIRPTSASGHNRTPRQRVDGGVYYSAL